MKEVNSNTDISSLYGQYQEKVLKYLKNICRDADTAEDVCQETFIRVQKSFHTFNPSKGSFISWIKTIAKNICIRSLSKNTRYEPNSEKMEREADKRTGTEDIVQNKSLKKIIKKAIECLPEPERSIVYDKYIHNLTLDEIAERAGISRRTVSRKYLSALDMLKNVLIAEEIGLTD